MVELVWNSDRSATVLTSSGALTKVGSPGEYLPEDLVCMATASCLMRTFLALAEGMSLSVLSYASAARVQFPSADPRPRVMVNVYIAVPTGIDASAAHRLCHACTDTSTVASLLGDRLTVACDVRVVCGTAAVVH